MLFNVAPAPGLLDHLSNLQGLTRNNGTEEAEINQAQRKIDA